MNANNSVTVFTDKVNQPSHKGRSYDIVSVSSYESENREVYRVLRASSV